MQDSAGGQGGLGGAGGGGGADSGEDGPTFYIAPGGDDANTGMSASSPWKTFAHAVAQLRPGDTLILEDGIYTPGNTGTLRVDCSANARNGMSGAPITVRAQHERQAFIQGDGAGTPFWLTHCAWWIIEGLHIENMDNPNGNGGDGADITNGSHDIVFRRNLVANPNCWGNNGGIGVYYDCDNVLVEENELYSFHRNGIECYPETTSHCVIRRNYVNPRGKAYCGSRTGPNDGIVLYFAHDSIVENNIVEDDGTVTFTNFGSNNSFLGNVAINSSDGALSGRHSQYGPNNSGNLIENNVSLHCMWGFGGSSDEGVRFLNNTAIASWNGSCGFAFGNGVDQRQNPNCGTSGNDPCWSVTPNVQMINDLAVDDPDACGFLIAQSDQFGSIVLDHLNAFNNHPNFSIGTSSRTNSTEIDPRLGSCKVWIPDASPMKRAGANGADIGANVLYRYQNGVPTNEPLWDPATGEFPHGAIVTGLNDVPGHSLFDVHQRLNINTNGCPFPAGYPAR